MLYRKNFQMFFGVAQAQIKSRIWTWLNLGPRHLHWSVVSPVCVRLCLCSSSDRVNRFPHNIQLHTNGLSPVCHLQPQKHILLQSGLVCTTKWHNFLLVQLSSRVEWGLHHSINSTLIILPFSIYSWHCLSILVLNFIFYQFFSYTLFLSTLHAYSQSNATI